MSDIDPQARFEEVVLPHLDAAYNLARWLAGNDHDAEDITQEASLRAFRFAGGFRGGNGRSWLLTIVRHTAYTWLKRNRTQSLVPVNDEELAEVEDPATATEPPGVFRADAAVLRAALEELPEVLREAIVLRELEGLAYKEIADITGAPLGTIMSRLARARRQLQLYLSRKGDRL